MSYKGTRRSKLNPILFSIALLLGVAWWMAGMPLDSAAEAWRAGDYESAVASLDKGARFHLRPADYAHMYGAVYLGAGETDKAKPYLDDLAGRKADWFAPLRKDEVGKRLIGEGAYSSFLDYDTMVDEKRSSPELVLYRSAAHLGNGDLQQARASFETIDDSNVDPEAYQALRRGIDEHASGGFPLILDRTGETIATWQIDNSDLVATNSNFELLVDQSGGTTSIEANLDRQGNTKKIVTTLDSQIQRAAIAALGSRRGSIVVIDTKTHEIVAAASSKGSGDAKNLAFAGSYEPGSIIKVLTQIQAIDKGVNLSEVFPLDCKGFIIIDGQQFFDWARHGEVTGLDEAMAVSCNVVYGKLGLALGTTEIQEFMRKAGFGKGADLGLFKIGLGTIIGDPLTNFQTANLGVGLNHYRMNALHLAMLADALANGGVMRSPTMLKNYRTVLGEDIAVERIDSEVRIGSEEAVASVINSMKNVISSERGTGRRARLEGFEFAIKTGTAGERPYDSVILGVMPADNSQFAFGIIGEGTGPAEYEGAAITRELVQRIRDRAEPTE